METDLTDLRRKLREIRVRKEVVLLYKGHIVLDARLAKILEEVERRGSLLAAARSQGISYSWAWSRVNRVEELLGEKLISVRRGGSRGGGATLTDLGRELLKIYMDTLTEGRVEPKGESTLAAGYDPLLEKVLEPLRDRIDLHWSGSLGGIAKLVAGEADVAAIHLYDPESGQFNRPFIDRFWLSNSVVLVRGYDREIGIMFRRDMQLERVSDIIEKGLRYVNMPPGSGTRLLADRILMMEVRRLGLEDPDPSKFVRGYDVQVRTHVGVAKKIVKGEADVGFGIREIAESFQLGFLRVLWESYDFAVWKDSFKKPSIEELVERLKSGDARRLASELRGYRIPEDMGEVVA